MTSLILGLLKHLQHKRRVLGVAVLAVLVSMSEAISLGLVVPFLALLANPNSLSEHLDRLRLPLPDVVSFSLDSLAMVSAAFVAAIAMAAILRVALAWYQNRVSVLIGVDLSAQIFERNLRKPYVDQISRHTSELMAVIGKAEALPNTLINPILTIFSSSFVLVTLFAVVVMANPHVALSVVGSLTLFYFLVTALTKRRVFTNGLIIARQLASVSKAILEGSTDTRSVIIGQRQYFFARAYRLASLALQYAEVSNRVTATVPRFLVEAVSIAVIVITANILLQTNTGITPVVIADATKSFNTKSRRHRELHPHAVANLRQVTTKVSDAISLRAVSKSTFDLAYAVSGSSGAVSSRGRFNAVP